jgi:hypothetical protein
LKRSGAPEALRRLLLLTSLTGTVGLGFLPHGEPILLPDRAAAQDADTTRPVLRRWERLDSLETGGVPPLAKGDPIRIRTYWNRDDLTITADLRNVAPLDTLPVLLSALGDSAYLLEHTLPDSTHPDAAGIRIPLTAESPGGMTTIDSSLAVCLSNQPPKATSIQIRPARVAYQPGNFLRIESTWDHAPGLGVIEVSADVRGIDPGAADSLVPAQQIGDLFRIEYRIPWHAENGEGLVIPLLARDAGCGVTVDSSVAITIDADAAIDPVLLEFARLDTLDDGRPRSLRNGDTIRIWTRWDRDSLLVSADFFALAPDAEPAFVEDLGGGEHKIIFTIPVENHVSDASGIPVPITAEDQRGRVTTDNSVRVCLSNHPPLFLASRIAEKRDVYTRGDTLRMVSAWQSTNFPASLLKVSADVSAIEPATADTTFPATFDADADSFFVEYRIPFNRDLLGPDSHSITVPLVCRDPGCGITYDYSNVIALDATPPDSVPVLDPLPAETNEDSILVRGSSTGATLVGLLTFGTFRSFVAPDSLTGRFEGSVVLTPDRENRITAVAEDEVGNRTVQSEPRFVKQVSTRSMEIPQPFTRGGEIIVRDPGGIERLSVRLYDLEGVCLQEWTVPGPVLEQSFTWDGRDRNGDRARQGYFLLRAEWRDASGRSRNLTEGLILKD